MGTFKQRADAAMEMPTAPQKDDESGDIQPTPGGLTAAKGSYDKGNSKKHANRLLLEAEPQIGKTGAFLNVCFKLRKKIEGYEEDEDETSFSDEPEEFEEINNVSEAVTVLNAKDWQHPYWKTMSRAPALPETVKNGKYVRVYGVYTFGRKPEALMSQKKSGACNTTVKGNVKQDFNPPKKFDFSGSLYKALRAGECSCHKCSRDTNTVIYNITIQEELVQLSVPQSHRFQSVRDMLGIEAANVSQWQMSESLTADVTNPERTSVNAREKLATWIFTPSYKRVYSARLNLTHSMVDMKTGVRADYIQVIVVRSEEFKTYAEQWQATHAILQLPDRLLIDTDDEANVNEGGIGFARLFIQLFAERYNMDYIFVLDDNISHLYEAVREERDGMEIMARDENNCLQLQNVAMFAVLREMELLHEHQNQKPPAKAYCSFPVSRQCCDLHGYTGSPDQYAITGIMKSQKFVRQMTQPFGKVHVFSLVLLNIKILAQNKIRYKPFQVYEDFTINNACDKAGLWVCKYRKFVMAKTHLATWMPRVYVWTANSSLESMSNQPETEDGIGPLVRWLKCNCPPKRFHVIPPSNFDLSEDAGISGLVQSINQIRCGSHLCLLVMGASESEMEKLQEFYSGTCGIGGFQTHALFLSTHLCEMMSLLTLADFRVKVVCPIFGDVNFRVIASHNIAHCKVPLLLLYIEGKGKLASNI